MKISQRAQNITPSATLALSAKAKQMKASGIDGDQLSIGEPEFNMPATLKMRLLQPRKRKSILHSGNRWLELREAIAKFINDDCNAEFSKENVAVAAGGKMALFAIAQTIMIDI